MSSAHIAASCEHVHARFGISDRVITGRILSTRISTGRSVRRNILRTLLQSGTLPDDVQLLVNVSIYPLTLIKLEGSQVCPYDRVCTGLRDEETMEE